MGEWIGEVLFDDAVVRKILTKHRLSPDEVREAICWGAAEAVRWDDDPHRGSRLLAIGTTSNGVRIKTVLLPIDRSDGTWRCKTAMRVTRWGR